LTLFVVSFVLLGYLGLKNPNNVDLILFKNVVWAQILTIVYFLFFLLMPFYSKADKTKPEPDRVSFK
jgi:ubiquinol-cytochrome c reductase cytochrome b subunit